jgi:ATPase family associated with various cellular activities (AAA)
MRRGPVADFGVHDDRPELADIPRIARRLIRWAVQAARTEETPLAAMLHRHLGPEAAGFGVVSGSWPGYDLVNVQVGLNGWLAGWRREHELVGLTGYQHESFGLADLLQPGAERMWLGVGSVAMAALPAGPAGQTLACVKCGLYLASDGDTRFALLLRGPGDANPDGDTTLEVACADQAAALRVVDEVRRLATARNVFRGHVISFGDGMFGPGRGGAGGLRFHDRPQLGRDAVVLPPAVIEGIEQQVLGVARHAGRLLASGQHLKRGVLLHGAPGTGKTHTVRYLIGQLAGVTVVILSGHALTWIGQACSVARLLAPSVVVIEDVDLIAEERGPGMGQHPLLFELLNEMDGLGQDADVTFLLTTNRPDLLEAALATRPGRVDHAAELPLPDADARRRLIELYRGSLVLDLSAPDDVIKRTDGVTAAFIKELLRRAAVLAAEAEPAAGPATDGDRAGPPLRLTDVHLSEALDQLLDVRSRLTRTLLGGRGVGQDAVIRPMGADAVLRRSHALILQPRKKPGSARRT